MISTNGFVQYAFASAKSDFLNWNSNGVILTIIAVAFGILGMVLVKCCISLVNLLLALMLGYAVYGLLLSVPGLSGLLSGSAVASTIILVVVIIGAFLLMHYLSNLTTIIATALFGGYLVIAGLDCFGETGTTDIVLHGLKGINQVKNPLVAYIIVIVGAVTAGVGIFYQLKRY